MANSLSKEAEMKLRQQAYDLLDLFHNPSPSLCNPTPEEKKVLEIQEGLVFLPLEPLTYAKEVSQHSQHYSPFEQENSQRFDSLRRYKLPRIFEGQIMKPWEVGFIENIGYRDPFRTADDPFWGHGNKSRPEALSLIDQYSKSLATRFPDFRAIMLPVIGYAMAERIYAERNQGKSLLDKFYAWALEDLDYYLAGPCRVEAALVGRTFSMNPCNENFDKTAPRVRIFVEMETEDTHNEYTRCFPAIIKIQQQPKPVSDVEQWRPAASS